MPKPLKTNERNKISDSEIKVIRETYKREGSIEKTKEITGYSKNTVNKYVRDLSSLKQNSRYNARKVLKIVPETLKIVKEYPNTRIACIVEHIERSNLNKALIGKTKTAGGFVWAYKGEEQLKTPVKKYFVNLIRQEDILLGLK